MRNQRMLWVFQVLLKLSIVLIMAGCTGSASEPTSTPKPVIPTSDPAPIPASLIINTLPPTSTEESQSTATASPMPTMELNGSVLYHDDFRNPDTGWLVENLDNSSSRYQSPEYYRIDVTAADGLTSVYVPGGQVFEDATIELKVSAISAGTGDFRYGIVYRREKDSFYAFVISPQTQKWYVLKNSAKALEILKEGTFDGFVGPESEDILRVDIKGGTFFLHINDQLVGQKGDFGYTKGEIGLLVQTLDSPGVSIYFNELTIRGFQSPLIETNCANGVDDDGDGLIDKTDPDCLGLATLVPFVTEIPGTLPMASTPSSIPACVPEPDLQCDPSAPYDPRICDCGAFVPGGCTDPGASNYDPKAPYDDGSCVYEVYGCTDSDALNYDPNATIDDGSCEYPPPTDPPPTDPPPTP